VAFDALSDLNSGLGGGDKGLYGAEWLFNAANASNADWRASGVVKGLVGGYLSTGVDMLAMLGPRAEMRSIDPN
jgi:hypothetical protein